MTIEVSWWLELYYKAVSYRIKVAWSYGSSVWSAGSSIVVAAADMLVSQCDGTAIGKGFGSCLVTAAEVVWTELRLQ
jgi:hypothetical protein